jgi:hypothetical protein
MCGNGAVRSGMALFAQSKLIGRRDIAKFVNDKRSVLAALSTRLLLDFEPKRDSVRKFEMELVKGNMRIAYIVPSHREYVRSGTPSEPILAEGAAREMDLMRRNNKPIPETLATFVTSGLIANGERGECVAKLLFLEAYDRAVNAPVEHPTKAQSIFGKDQSRFSQPIHLRDFFLQLFGEEHLEKIWSSYADNDSEVGNLGQAFEHAYVRFSHFGRDHEENHPSTYTAWAALARGMAVQCSPNQDVIDIVIPVVLCEDVEKDKLDETNLTAILVQVRNRTGKQRVRIDEALISKKRGFFPWRPGDVRPYITLVMDL